MKSTRYTFIIIPDSGESDKRFTLSRTALRLFIFLAVIIFLVIILLGVYTIPRSFQYNSLQGKYNEIASERLEVLRIMQDVQQMRRMDQQIRKTLGFEMKFTPEEGLDDSTSVIIAPGYIPEEDIHISYVENIPSLAPVQGYITQKVHKTSILQILNHYGIDIAVKRGEAVVSSASGIVIFSGWTYDTGNLIIIYHGDGYFTYYGHNQQNLVSSHEVVKRSEAIALTGSTGISSGPHLHFEIWKGGKSIDPLIFFPEYSKVDISPENNYE